MAEESQAAEAAVAEPESTTVRRKKADDKKKPKRLPPYQVILWNDDDHSFIYVVEMLLSLFGHPPERGFQLAQEVHLRGRAIVLTTTKEHAELKRDQIHAYGKDRDVRGCKGSMSATIEPMPQ